MEEIMPKTALVLSGGGAKGAFQFAAETYAREVKGFAWDIIAGISVGALNGAMLAMEKYDRLEYLWRTVTADQVLTGGLSFWSILKLLFGAKSVYNNDPLWQLMQEEFDLALIKADLRIGAVSLRTGRYERYTPYDAGFMEAVLASTAIPLAFPPVNVPPDQMDMVDGGVRNISPLGDVLDSDPDRIVIINCSSREPTVQPGPFKNALEIGMATIDIMLNEIFVTDLEAFVRINRNVQEAQALGGSLTNERGKEYKAYEYYIIEPDEPLGDTLDFSRDILNMRLEAGWRKAQEVLG
jgi:NTE family protein